MQKLVSIITVYYNREKVVDDSIKSLLNQTYKNTEIIVIDDGSTDSTYQKLCSFQDPRLRIIKHQNMGFVKSVKKAVSISNGEYIAIHGSGDISHPGRIEKQVEVLENDSTIGIVSNQAKKTDLNATYERITDNRFVEGDDDYIKQLIDKSIIIHGSAMFRKSVYDTVGGYREFFKFGQDRDLWLRMCILSKPYIIPEVLYTMFVLPDSVSDDFQKRVMQLFFQSMSNQCIVLRIQGVEDYVDKYGCHAAFHRPRDKRLSNKLFRTAITEISKDEFENAIIALRLSINERNTIINNLILKLMVFVIDKEKFRKLLHFLVSKLKKHTF